MVQNTHGPTAGRRDAIFLLSTLWALPWLAQARPSNQVGSKISALAFDEANQAIWKGYGDGRLTRSGDGGRTWAAAALPASSGAVVAIAAPPQLQNRLYVAVRGLGILASSDAGQRWQIRTKGLPSHQVSALAVHATQPATVYVVVAGKGIFKSDDAGKQWQLMDRGPRQRIASFFHSDMPGSMQTGWLFAATDRGVGRSMDCFCGWHDAGGLASRVHAVAYSPREPRHVYAALDNGLVMSKDGGQAWSPIMSPAIAVSALTANAAGVLYAAGQDRLYRTTNHGALWESVNA